MKRIKCLIIITPLLVALTGLLLIFQAIAAQSGMVHDDEFGHNPQSLEKGAGLQQQPSIKKYLKYRLDEGYFECEVSEEWVNMRDRSEDERTKVYGMIFIFKDSKPGIKPWIDVSYYALGNSYFANADAYLERQFAPPLIKLKGEQISEIREVLVNGFHAKQFTRDTLGFWPPHSMNTKEIKVREEYTVIQVGREFCVLMYSAPENQFLKYRPDYQHILDTFKAFSIVHGDGDAKKLIRQNG